MLTIKKDSPIEPEVLEALRYIQDASKKMDVSYLVVGGKAIDLLPFGKLEKPSGVLSWPPDGDMIMNVSGFRDINSAAEEIKLVKNKTVMRVASLPGLVLLKLLAWNDRFESKDEQDIAILLCKYNMTLSEERLYEDEELLKVSGFNMEMVGAALLGRDAGAILSLKNVNIVKAVLNKKEKLLNAIANGLPGLELDKSFATAEKLFGAFCEGFSGESY